MFDCNVVKYKDDNMIRYRRVRTEELINKFRNELLTKTWKNVYEENNTDKAYGTFPTIFNSL